MPAQLLCPSLLPETQAQKVPRVSAPQGPHIQCPHCPFPRSFPRKVREHKWILLLGGDPNDILKLRHSSLSLRGLEFHTVFQAGSTRTEKPHSGVQFASALPGSKCLVWTRGASTRKMSQELVIHVRTKTDTRFPSLNS